MRDEFLEQQQEEETKVPYVEGQRLKNEAIARETDTHVNLNIPDISIDLQDEYADIFRRLDIPWKPTDEQNIATGKPFDSDRENMQRAHKQYKYQLKYL